VSKVKELMTKGKPKVEGRRISLTLRNETLAAFNYLKEKFPEAASDVAIVEACILAGAMDEGFESKKE